MNLLFTNAKVHTLDDRNSIFNSVAIDGDRIITVGDDIRPHDTDYHEIDLDGADIYPGFVDAHAHIY